MAYIPLRKAVEFLGLHPNTLRRYADEGKIKSIKNPAGQRLYDVESYIRGDSIRTPTICYCRVGCKFEQLYILFVPVQIARLDILLKINVIHL